MKEKITNDRAIGLYAILRDARISRLESEARCRIVRAARALTPAAEEFDALRRDAVERLSPAVHDAVGEARQGQEVEQVLRGYLQEERELELPRLSVDEIDGLVGQNDFTTLQIMLLEDMLKEG